MSDEKPNVPAMAVIDPQGTTGEGPGENPGPETGPAPSAESLEDLELLKEIDWVNASITRFRQGRHGQSETEALLGRRLDFPRYQFLAPYPLRVLCTFGFCLAGCGLTWFGFWAVFTVFGFEQFLRELSLAMTMLMMALFGIGLTHPLEIYNESELEKTGNEVLRQLRTDHAGKSDDLR